MLAGVGCPCCGPYLLRRILHQGSAAAYHGRGIRSCAIVCCLSLMKTFHSTGWSRATRCELPVRHRRGLECRVSMLDAALACLGLTASATLCAMHSDACVCVVGGTPSADNFPRRVERVCRVSTWPSAFKAVPARPVSTELAARQGLHCCRGLRHCRCAVCRSLGHSGDRHHAASADQLHMLLPD